MEQVPVAGIPVHSAAPGGTENQFGQPIQMGLPPDKEPKE